MDTKRLYSILRTPGELSKVRGAAFDYFRRNPLLCTGVAAGVGFVLGGGLTTGTSLRLLRKGLGLALQVTVLPILVSRLRDAVLDATETGETR